MKWLRIDLFGRDLRAINVILRSKRSNVPRATTAFKFRTREFCSWQRCFIINAKSSARQSFCSSSYSKMLAVSMVLGPVAPGTRLSSFTVASQIKSSPIPVVVVADDVVLDQPLHSGPIRVGYPCLMDGTLLLPPRSESTRPHHNSTLFIEQHLNLAPLCATNNDDNIRYFYTTSTYRCTSITTFRKSSGT